jgi:hypothetical protein
MCTYIHENHDLVQIGLRKTLAKTKEGRFRQAKNRDNCPRVSPYRLRESYR